MSSVFFCLLQVHGLKERTLTKGQSAGLVHCTTLQLSHCCKNNLGVSLSDKAVHILKLMREKWFAEESTRCRHLCCPCNKLRERAYQHHWVLLAVALVQGHVSAIVMKIDPDVLSVVFQH